MRGLLVLALLGACLTAPAMAREFQSEQHDFRLTPVVEGLDYPWGLSFLPGGRMLVTERPGRLRLVEDGQLHPEPVAGLPEIAAEGQGGLLDVALHPDYADNGWLYLSYSGRGEGGLSTEVSRARLSDHRLSDVETLFVALPKSSGGRHFGSRLAFDDAGYLYITLGDRGNRPVAQDLADHNGSVIRLHDDGRVPADNPFVDQPNTRPEIYTYGNRNMQGASFDAATGRLWAHEHGPRGGDELNLVQAGHNYGWPMVTHGISYGGMPIGEGETMPGVTDPVYYWDPSIAPSGLTVYRGDAFPAWQGDIFVGALKFQLLARLEMDGERVVAEERLLENQIGRIRDVVEGPDGYLYLLTDQRGGGIYRLEPLG